VRAAALLHPESFAAVKLDPLAFDLDAEALDLQLPDLSESWPW
jgi:hypothetical protein